MAYHPTINPHSRVALDTYRTCLSLIPDTLTVLVSANRGVPSEIGDRLISAVFLQSQWRWFVTIALDKHPCGSSERLAHLIATLNEIGGKEGVLNVDVLDPFYVDCEDPES